MGLLIHLLIIMLIIGVVWWVITMIPLPPPMGQIVRVVFGVICAIIIIYFLLGLTGCQSTIPGMSGSLAVSYNPNSSAQSQQHHHRQRNHAHKPATLNDK